MYLSDVKLHQCINYEEHLLLVVTPFNGWQNLWNFKQLLPSRENNSK